MDSWRENLQFRPYNERFECSIQGFKPSGWPHVFNMLRNVESYYLRV